MKIKYKILQDVEIVGLSIKRLQKGFLKSFLDIFLKDIQKLKIIIQLFLIFGVKKY